MKLQAFHSALGEDSQIYSQEEEYDSFGLFEKVPEEEKDERLEYLNFLRKFRDQNHDLYNQIRNTVPFRARVGRKNKSSIGQTITFIKNKKRDCFYLIYTDLSFEELTFVEASRIFKAEISERSIPIHEQHYEQINTALISFNEDENISNLGDKASVVLGPNEKRAIAFITDYIRQEFATNEEKDLLEMAKLTIRRGKFQKLPREINKLLKSGHKSGMKRATVFEELISVIRSYPVYETFEEDSEAKSDKKVKPRLLKELPKIIISESFSN